MNDPFNPEVQPLEPALLDPATWAEFGDGYLSGYTAGFGAGRLFGNTEALDVAPDLTWTASHEALQRRRREYRGITGKPVKALTPEQIRAQAAYSWRRAERENAKKERTSA